MHIKHDILTATHQNQHAIGGTFMAGISDRDNCIRACTEPCHGVDFDTNGNTCWLHDQLTSCSNLNNKTSCTHYRLRPCE